MDAVGGIGIDLVYLQTAELLTFLKINLESFLSSYLISLFNLLLGEAEDGNSNND